MHMTLPLPRFMTIDYIYGPVSQAVNRWAVKPDVRPPEIF